MEKRLAPLKKIQRLEVFYVATVGILMLMVVGTPFLVRRWIMMTKYWSKEQELLETLLIAVLLSVAYALSQIYKKLLKDYAEEIQQLAMNNEGLQGRLTDAFKYIGKINVELQEIRSAFALLNRLPQSRKDFKNLLRVFAQKALTIANADWVIVRIIDRSSLRTVAEHLESRQKRIADSPPIANKIIVAGEAISGLAVVRCENKNLDITVACIFSRNELGWEEKILLGAMVGEIELFFIAYISMNFMGLNQRRIAFPRL